MRPELNRDIKPEEFLNYYWLKSELSEFCKKHDIPKNGSKEELTKRILHFIKTGKILKGEPKRTENKNVISGEITIYSIVQKGYKNDEKNRNFFKSVIGDHFKFNVPFMKWMKENHGKTYGEAIEEWLRIYQEKKSGKKYDISPQFEYNQYTREFFKENPKLTRADAIKCWKYKKSIPGNNKYENTDLEILTEKLTEKMKKGEF